MKHARHLIFLLAMALAALPLHAATPTAINGLFDGRFNDSPGARVTMMENGRLGKHSVRVFKSLSIENPDNGRASEIETAVKRDGSSATSREVQFRDGKLYYGFYTFPDKNKTHRYLLYLNQIPAGGTQLILIYIESSLSAKQIRELLK